MRVGNRKGPSYWLDPLKSEFAAHQYSDASIIVRTRLVMSGSDGSSLPDIMLGP